MRHIRVTVKWRSNQKNYYKNAVFMIKIFRNSANIFLQTISFNQTIRLLAKPLFSVWKKTIFNECSKVWEYPKNQLLYKMGFSYWFQEYLSWGADFLRQYCSQTANATSRADLTYGKCVCGYVYLCSTCCNMTFHATNHILRQSGVSLVVNIKKQAFFKPKGFSIFKYSWTWPT